MYKKLIRPILFNIDPETIHDISIQIFSLGQLPGAQAAVRSIAGFEDKRLEVEFCGVSFKNPLGLAAGFDKNAKGIGALAALGFGHVEVGTIAGKAQPGNPRPRIVRCSNDSALINCMGFPSEGVDAVAPRLEKVKNAGYPCVVGVNIGKSKVVPIDDAISDYLYSFDKIKNLADFVVLNISSPNTPELRKMQERSRLLELYREIQKRNDFNKAILVKVAPDLSTEELDEILGVCEEAGVSGIIATNTTIERTGISKNADAKGGVSGKPLRTRSRDMVRHIYQETSGRLPIIGVGGVFGAEDALEMIRAGASLVQAYTGFVYEGPLIAKRIKKGLLAELDRSGARSIAELVGTSAKS